jgi:FkbM family methyltransferase
MIGYRSNKRIIQALLRPSTYRSAWNMLRFYTDPLDAIRRYVFGTGVYPTVIRGRAPVGVVDIHIFHPHDMQTINEVFCRRDYPVSTSALRIVDVGANIGISAMYFLTQAPNAFVYLFEPLPANIERLKENLKPFEGRYRLFPMAVFNRSGTVEFHTEPIGRYSQIATSEHQTDRQACIEVECRHISEALREIIEEAQGGIDLLKIDIEGLEEVVIEAIDIDLASSIGMIIYETNRAGKVGVIKPSQRHGKALIDRNEIET